MSGGHRVSPGRCWSRVIWLGWKCYFCTWGNAGAKFMGRGSRWQLQVRAVHRSQKQSYFKSTVQVVLTKLTVQDVLTKSTVQDVLHNIQNSNCVVDYWNCGLEKADTQVLTSVWFNIAMLSLGEIYWVIGLGKTIVFTMTYVGIFSDVSYSLCNNIILWS